MMVVRGDILVSATGAKHRNVLTSYLGSYLVKENVYCMYFTTSLF